MEFPVRSRLLGYAEATRQGTGVFWLRLKKWFLAASIVGVLVGLAVTAVHWLVYEVLWGAVSQYAMTPWGTLLFPTIGLALSGFILQRFTKDPNLHGTEEVIEVFHHNRGVFDYRSAPGKVMAAVATLGFGGSAGLEGPSIYIGGVVGSYVMRKSKRLGFDENDVRTLMIAGSAAGVAAIFKAPLTGIIFALEVPYMDDMTREALIPSLVASVSAYLVLVAFLGVSPLFYVAQRYTMAPSDLGWAIVLGVVVGLLARIFIASFKRVSRLSRESGLPLWVRTGLGGLVVGLLGLVGHLLYGKPMVLGTGYDLVQGLVGGSFTTSEAFWLLILKTGAIVATLGSGAAGGVFIPMIVLGASAGSLMGGLLPAGSPAALFPVVGMAAFLAAGYNTPLAAAAFIAESTGGSGYLIPGLVGAAVAYAIAGKTSISTSQRWRRESRLDRMLGIRVSDIMTRDVIGVPQDITLRDFVSDYVVRLRHKSFPVLDGKKLVGIIGLSDVNRFTSDERGVVLVSEVMARDVATALPGDTVRRVVELMTEGDFDRVPIVEAEGSDRIAGVVSSTDIVKLDGILEPARGAITS
ncbi:MAG: chemotaxis protein [Actinobacteria bacterium HGW-Actinobacteria-6]|nr:MAG: chemotaxis protein [Actinobacteria bacterium HGW-Actinobacteria-6]